MQKYLPLAVGVVLGLAISVRYSVKIGDKITVKFEKPGLLDLVNKNKVREN